MIRDNLDKSPLYAGRIEGVGPRYCPSIEDKVVKFAEKECHQIFLEPEGRHTEEIYVNGVSTSLPMEVQYAFIRTHSRAGECRNHAARLCGRIRFLPADPASPTRSKRSGFRVFISPDRSMGRPATRRRPHKGW